MYKNENGFTLAEVIASAIIVVIASIALYVGIVYVERNIMRNYHDRVALWHAAGELDKQRFSYNTYGKQLSPFQDKTVLIDDQGPIRIDGTMHYEKLAIVPPDIVLQNIPYTAIEISVQWTERAGGEQREIVLREDFYRE